MKNHLQLGKELDLFIQSPTVGKGLPLLTEKGNCIKRSMIKLVEELEEKNGYLLTSTPLMASKNLYEISGHWDLYKEDMFVLEAGPEDYYALRPMTCPFQFQLYLRKKHSYKELPIRYSETSTLFRNEPTGSIHGLNRIRQFTLSDGHIICRFDQIEKEFLNCLDIINTIMAKLDFKNFWFRFSTRDPQKKNKYIENDSAWEKSESLLKSFLVKHNISYSDGKGEAAFYGPKLDIQMKDAEGREETLFTLQLDFALAERFGMTYTDENNKEEHPYIIHRSSIGCYERTLAHLLEIHQGALPFWLMPTQIMIIPVNDKHLDYALKVQDFLTDSKFRVEIDKRTETLGKRIREAVKIRTPYLIIIGEKEIATKTINVRKRGQKDSTQITLDQFKQMLKNQY
ncbi:threonine--tRNA ligase [Spirochaeta cellobiosiphila]|uniref:threonine--tRNA ligase n=1 Tax=Spirochaeta cellobiosiphila TaxID=504483 RepID=UPI0003F8BC49|nr:threonine--tRNA ligase [Spirochaeta cellobiosiphila]